MKRKIGTVVDDNLYNEVKLLATQERRTIADVVQLALGEYVQRSKSRASDRIGLGRLLEPDPLPQSMPRGDHSMVIADPPYRR